jgi:DNA-binding MarR family transcriptional regulator
VVSGETLESKFKVIERVFENIDVIILGQHITLSGDVINGFFGPAAVTVFYIYGYPSLAKPVYEHSLSKQRELSEIKQKKENMRLLSVEESRELYKKLAQLQDEFDRETEGYRKQVAGLSQTIVELEQKLSQQPVEKDSGVNDISHSLSKDEEEVLAEFVGLDEAEGRTAGRVQESLGWHIDKVRMHMDTLVQKNFLHKESLDSGRVTLYLLNPIGRQYLVEHHLFSSI